MWSNTLPSFCVRRVLPDYLEAHPEWSAVSTDGLTWLFLLKGAAGSCHEGAEYEIKLAYPDNYPFAAPVLTFKHSPETTHSRVPYHPNINDDGAVCAEAFGIGPQWAPAIKIDKILTSILERIETPELSHGLRQDVTDQYASDRPAYDAACKAQIASSK